MCRTNKVALAVALALSVGSPALGQTATEFEKLLVPIYVEAPLAGAFGSSWITDFWMKNDGDVAFEVRDYDWNCVLPECPFGPPLQPSVTFRPRAFRPPDGFQGTFLEADRRYADQLTFSLRFRDLSRQSETWGTEVPVVREAQFRSRKFSLLDVPVTQGFRQVLRIYELTRSRADALVRIRAFRLDPAHTLPSAPPDEFLGETVVALQFVTPLFDRNPYPGYVAVSDLGTIAPLGGAERIRLEIESVTPGLRLWAFVTVVNNETQHATVITPQ